MKTNLFAIENLYKKITLCLCASAAILCLLSQGCSNIEKNGTTIVYHTIESLPEQIDALKLLVKEFEKKNPDIKVRIETAPSGTASVFQKLKISIAGQNPPDVFYMVTDRLDEYIQKGAILDISDYVKNDFPSIENVYFPQAVKSCYKNGRIYCFPFHFSTDILFYNKDLFDSAGVDYPKDKWNWNDLLKTAEKTRVRDNRRIKVFGVLQPRPLMVIRSFGGEVFKINPLRCTINSEETKQALQFLIDLNKKYQVSPINAALNPGERSQVEMDMFKSGKVAMFTGRTYMLIDFAGIKDFNWDIAFIPTGKKHYSRLAVGGNCISSVTENPEAAWKFVKFYSSVEGSKIMGQKRNCVPACIDIAKSDIFLAPPPKNIEKAILQIKTSEMEIYPVKGWREFLEKEFMPTIDKILLGKISVEKGVSSLERKAKNLLSTKN